MFELIQAGGWLMVPIIGSSILALAIITERFITLRYSRVVPRGLLAQVWELVRSGEMTPERMRIIKQESPLGLIVVAGLNSSSHGREVMKESIQEAATVVVHELERFLNSLGTIAAITPLLGLLGTVIGMIKVFTEIMIQGTGNANVLAGGISEALITTAAGLSVAIPTLVLHRYFQRKVDTLVLTMEQESIKLVEIVHGERDVDFR
ncbi:MotA/TolQ/ExbB proton channel family protein [Marinobacterium lacunae]|uniref:MotA/TolQ/ExbB proton channel family protein n=1 Tax=Marinobacterium lacunae TaxID=1232683 RepID=A0A081FTZ1_9GAMM|nr:MotA/TolQ/ExbB proton channel family protein [Marinobacterium lacunae]KEA61996.1 MotA/TolQ/ExbB proton channel family protein [Marinobacterium lacunae]MBR9882828.1 MotA/TolQ/ExbB proton channel family protein [Oceanospirillales bacterium]